MALKKILIAIMLILIVVFTGVGGDNYITFLFEREEFYLDNDDYIVSTFPIDTIEVEFICKENMKHTVNIEGYQSTLTIDGCWYNENGMYLDMHFENSVRYRGGSIIALEEFVDDYELPYFLDIYVFGDTVGQAEPIRDGSLFDNGRLVYRLLFMGVNYSENSQKYTISIQGMIENDFVRN